MSNEQAAPAAQVAQVVEAVVESPKTEAPPQSEPQKPETPKQEEIDFSSRFAALSRREKMLLEKERKIKEMEKQNSEKLGKYEGWEKKKSDLKSNPDLIFEELGMSFEDLVNYKLGIEKEKPAPLSADEMYKKIQQELEEKFNKLEEEKKLAKEQENSQILEDFKNDIVATVKRNSDKYELINYQGNYDLVFDVIDEYYQQHGEVLDIDQAADQVEVYLESLVEGATKLKKFQTKLQPKQEVKEEPVIQREEPAKENKPTLSNALNSGNTGYRSPTASLEESKARAAKLLRWT